MVGETNSPSPWMGGSPINAALGALEKKLVEITQFDWPPKAVVDQPGGGLGAFMLSKFWVKVVAETIWPSGRLKWSVPRLVAPSWSWSDAVMAPPHVPLAVKVNGRLADAPSAGNTP